MRTVMLVSALALAAGSAMAQSSDPAVLTPERVFANPSLSGPVAQGVTLGVRQSLGDAPGDFPTVGDGAFLGARSTVLGGVHVGAGAVVGAHTLVLHDVAPGATVVGRTRALDA